ncbi:MAG: D-cysteine desulfhydrase family protein [Gammaproteobacteria bacterium]|nr:D-cysteine desulfhydrase family protein [Gammaproteobacteria bacterium]
MSLDRFARASLAHLPTPLEPMANLSRLLGGPNLWVKRDDCTGLAMGGNKARQLEFYFGDALAQGADTVIITGAVQSNFVRQTAAACAKLGLACEIQLEHRVSNDTREYAASGNVLLDRLLGARIHYLPEGEDEQAADAALEAIADRVRSEGGRPYVIHLAPGHPPLGALGYVVAMEELLSQMAGRDLEFDAVVLPTGSAATHAGTLVGLRIQESSVRVIGACVRRERSLQVPRVLRQALATAELAGDPGIVAEDDVVVFDDWLGPGYGQATPEMKEAVTLAARQEGLLLDPVYTGKSMAALIGLARRGYFGGNANVLYLHTGGTPALFGYSSMLEDI